MTNSKPPSWNDIRMRASTFAAYWANKSDEQAQAQTFWIEFFAIFSIDLKRVATFEAHARRITTGNVGRIDLFWPRVLLAEHKSAGKSLDEAEAQALDYLESIDASEKPSVVISSDFARIRILDLERGGEAVTINTNDLAIEVERFGFIAGYKRPTFEAEEKANVQAARLMGSLYEELSKDGYEGHEASILLTRLLFLLFGDDTGMWQRGLFAEFIAERTNHDGSDLGPQLSLLFQELNHHESKRSQALDDYLRRFPYVNGRLFNERLDIPTFDRSMRDELLKCCAFDWGRISPAIFGSLFQTIKSKEARRELGEHYTPEKYILRTIGPLFLDDIRTRIEIAKDNAQQLKKIREQLRKQNYLDPACGCGNFLIVAYRELRRQELQILLHLQRLNPAETQLSLDPTLGLAVTLDQFSGIEIEEWPARIAETAMFLVDHQCNLELAQAFGETPDRLPITKTANIVIANALQSDWTTICPIGDHTYVFGNPPFSGTTLRTDEQKLDHAEVWREIRGALNLDIVTSWHLITARLISKCSGRAAFVSTNSITHGQQPPILWKELGALNIELDFAHETFAWNSEAPGRAAVHCVILGFSRIKIGKHKIVYRYESINGQPVAEEVSNINPYLIDGPTVLVESRRSPVSPDAQPMRYGSKPTDGGYLSNISSESAREIRTSDPIAGKYLRPLIGAKELINGDERWCLWLVDATNEDLRASNIIRERVTAVRKFRAGSRDSATIKDAATSHLFQATRQPNSSYLAVPSVSSESRKYVPMELLPAETIANNLVLTISNANLYTFGMLHSSVFMAWNAAVSGRLKSDYRISAEITYNNFPWPNVPPNKAAIEAAAQSVIETRGNHPAADLADLYDPLAMSRDLVDAHRSLDKQVLIAYGLAITATNNEILSELFTRYSALTTAEQLDLQAPNRKGTRSASAKKSDLRNESRAK